MTTRYAAPATQLWTNGDVPYEIPRVWAANTNLLSHVDDAVAGLNCALRGLVTIRSRRSGDHDYLVLHATTRVPAPSATTVGRRGGAQKLRCVLPTLVGDPSPAEGTVLRELCAALGVRQRADAVRSPAADRCVIETLKLLYSPTCQGKSGLSGSVSSAGRRPSRSSFQDRKRSWTVPDGPMP